MVSVVLLVVVVELTLRLGRSGDATRPAGKTLVLRATVPAKLRTLVTCIVDVLDVVSLTTRFWGVAETANPGWLLKLASWAVSGAGLTEMLVNMVMQALVPVTLTGGAQPYWNPT